MKSLIKVTEAISTACKKIGEYIIGVCGIGILVCMMFAIIPRNLFNFSFSWPEELARYFMIWVAFVGASVAMKKAELVSFEFFVSFFKGKGKIVANLIIKAITLYFLTAFFIIGVQILPSYAKSRSMGLPISLLWPALGLFVGGVFMLVHTINGVLHDVAEMTEKEEM